MFSLRSALVSKNSKSLACALALVAGTDAASAALTTRDNAVVAPPRLVPPSTSLTTPEIEWRVEKRSIFWKEDSVQTRTNQCRTMAEALETIFKYDAELGTFFCAGSPLKFAFRVNGVVTPTNTVASVEYRVIDGQQYLDVQGDITKISEWPLRLQLYFIHVQLAEPRKLKYQDEAQLVLSPNDIATRRKEMRDAAVEEAWRKTEEFYHLITKNIPYWSSLEVDAAWKALKERNNRK